MSSHSCLLSIYSFNSLSPFIYYIHGTIQKRLHNKNASRTDGYREIVGTNAANWSAVFKELKELKLKGVRCIISDDHTGLRNAIDRHFQGVVWQSCQVRFIRNILSQANKKDRAGLAKKLREITHAQTRDSALKRIVETIDDFEKTHPKIYEILGEQGEEILAVYQLPVRHRRSIRSTNIPDVIQPETQSSKMREQIRKTWLKI